jgi:acyl carrier protein
MNKTVKIMKNNGKIIQSIMDAIDEINERYPEEKRLSKSVDTVLTVQSGKLDSLGLVNFVVSVEERIQNDLGINISLADEIGKIDGALRTPETLAEHIANELQS